LKLNPHQVYLLEEFAEDYLERRLSRRDLIHKALLITGSVPLAATSLLALGCGDSDEDAEPAVTQPPPTPTIGAGTSVAEDDPAIQAQAVTYPGPAGDLKGYLARPRTGGPSAGLIVIHENRGLVPHISDVARRYAKEGFVALAVDMASRGGGSTEDTNQNMALLMQTQPADHVMDLQAGLNYLKSQNFVRAGGLGVTGFCYGGGYTFDLAANSQDIRAAVPFYGSVTNALPNLPSTRAAVLVVYGGNDTRITSQQPQVEQALAGKTFEIKVYEGANHAFFNDTGGSYNQQAAADAWPLAVGWLRRHLTG
jgi:carboxymethylenebutenolidase